MAYNMTYAGEYDPTDSNDIGADNFGWLHNDDVYLPPVPVSKDRNDNGKRKRTVGNSETGLKKKASKKTATVTDSQQRTSMTVEQDKIKQKQTHQVQHEEEKTSFETLSSELNDIRNIYQQMCAFKEKYSDDLHIQEQLNTCVELVKEILSDVEERMKQMPYCKICSNSPTTNPPKLVGDCGHKFCCNACIMNYFSLMQNSHNGTRLCLVCNIETDVMVLK